MSLLTIVQDAAAILGVLNSVPATVVNTYDSTINQLVALANTEGQFLAEDKQWQNLTVPVTFPATNNPVSAGNITSDQGLIEDLAPGYLYIIDDTLWLQNQPFKLLGPLSAQQRTALEAYRVQGAAWAYWIEGGHLYLSRPTLSTQNITFRYQSKNWVKKADGSTTNRMTADADSTLIPERCVMLGTVWRWLSRNGLPYQQEYLDYQQAVTQYTGRDGTRTVVDASGQSPSYNPQQSIIGGVMVVR